MFAPMYPVVVSMCDEPCPSKVTCTCQIFSLCHATYLGSACLVHSWQMRFAKFGQAAFWVATRFFCWFGQKVSVPLPLQRWLGEIGVLSYSIGTSCRRTLFILWTLILYASGRVVRTIHWGQCNDFAWYVSSITMHFTGFVLWPGSKFTDDVTS